MRTCNTCKSPFCGEIDGMILAGWDNKEIYRYLLGKYPGQVIPSYDSICNHARKHVKDEISRALKNSKQRDKIIREEIRGSIEAVEQLKRNLKMVSDMLKEIFSDGLEDRNARKELANLIGTANETINLLLKYQEKVDQKVLSEDEIFDKLMRCVYDFPEEYVNKMIERWNKDV